MNTNLKAFLDTIAVSEIGKPLLEKSDNGYNVLVGGSLFPDYSDHPRRSIQLNPTLRSTAAGRYQILSRYFDSYAQLLGLKDFSPVSQDAIAIQMIKEQGAMEDIVNGHFEQAIMKVRNIWASLPGAGYKQHENRLADLRTAFVDAGGKLGSTGMNLHKILAALSLAIITLLIIRSLIKRDKVSSSKINLDDLLIDPATKKISKAAVVLFGSFGVGSWVIVTAKLDGTLDSAMFLTYLGVFATPAVVKIIGDTQVKVKEMSNDTTTIVSQSAPEANINISGSPSVVPRRSSRGGKTR